MSTHGLGEITVGVPDVGAAAAFYAEFGLRQVTPANFATADGGEQLHLVSSPYRRLVEYTVAVDDPDDVARIRNRAVAGGHDVTDHPDGSVSVVEPLVGIRARAAVRRRVTQDPYTVDTTNDPGNSRRVGTRAPAIFREGPAKPRKLGHVLYTTPDLPASIDFLVDVFGFKVSDTSAGMIAFLRCSPDHHNVGLINAPVHFFHHSSWQVNDVDEIGQGAQHLLGGDPARSVWGLGRHFLGSNMFWYFRDPAGNYAEYYSDLDQIPEELQWDAKDWAPEKSLYAWGPPVPADFVQPPDLEQLIAAQQGAS